MPTYHVNTNTVDDFGPGNEVRYLPMWVNEDASHPDCQNGVVSHINERFVFVRYYDKETGDLDLRPKTTRPEDLINMSEA